MTLPAFAAERLLRPRAAVLLLTGAFDRYILRVWRSAANPPHAAAAFY